MTTRAQIAAEAQTWLGTTWVHQASRKGIGTDCAGLIVGVARTLGLPDAEAFDADARFKGYGRTPEARTLLAACDVYLKRIGIPEATLGDVLLLNWMDRGVPDPMHFAIVSSVDPPRVIHAIASIGRVVEHGLDATWRSRIVRAFSYRGVD